MENFNITFKAVVVAIAFFSVWIFVMHSSIIFGLIGAVCIALLYTTTNKKNKRYEKV